MDKLLERVDAALHPQTGLCRGMVLNTDKPHDRPGDLFPTTVGELLAVAALLRDCAAALRARASQSSNTGDTDGQ